MSNYRIEQINNLVQELLAGFIAKDFCAPHDSLVSLTRVECSGNLQEAKVFISVIPDQDRDYVVAGLNRGVHFFQEKLNKKLRMRPVPRIAFIGDDKPAAAQKVETLLEKLKESERH